MEDLKKCGMETPNLSLNGINTYAKVVNIIDGDTVVLIIPFLNRYFKFNCRLNNIDTCEIHSSNEKLKILGTKAKYRLLELVSKKKLTLDDNISKKDIQYIFSNECFIVYVKCYDFDKYGRLLLDLYLEKDEKSVSDILLEEKLAYVYTGKTKLNYEDQLNLLK